MNDVAKWKLRGAVRTLRKEFATWDVDHEQWQPAKHFSITSFHPGGMISASDTHNPDGSIAHSRWLYDQAGRLTESNFRMNDGPIDKVLYLYDELGRHQRTVRLSHDGTQTDQEISSYDARGAKTKLCILPFRGENISFGIEGTDQSYGDEKDLPAKVIFQDADGHPLREVVFIRDSAGRVVEDQMRVEGLPAMITNVLGEIFARTIYVYDARGRLAERTNKMGSLGEIRTTYRYEDRDDPVEETTENRNREASVDDDGAVHFSADSVSVHHHRLEYRYDEQGNWTERIVPTSNIERREIKYF